MEERRALLMEAGLRLFGDRPADEVAVEDIAREAGVSAGLLYHYFGSKKEFQIAVTAHAYDRVIEATEPDGDLPHGAQLVTSLRAYVHYVRANARWWAWLLRGGAGGDMRLEVLGGRLRELSSQRVMAGQPEGAVTPVVELAVRGWAGFNAEVVVSWLERRESGRLDISEDEVVTLMIEGLLATLQAVGLPARFVEGVRAEVAEAMAVPAGHAAP